MASLRELMRMRTWTMMKKRDKCQTQTKMKKTTTSNKSLMRLKFTISRRRMKAMKTKMSKQRLKKPTWTKSNTQNCINSINSKIRMKKN